LQKPYRDEDLRRVLQRAMAPAGAGNDAGPVGTGD
jgi:hypothetical protein